MISLQHQFRVGEEVTVSWKEVQILPSGLCKPEYHVRTCSAASYPVSCHMREHICALTSCFSSPSSPGILPSLTGSVVCVHVCVWVGVYVWWSQWDQWNTILGDNGLLLQDHKTQQLPLQLRSSLCFLGGKTVFTSIASLQSPPRHLTKCWLVSFCIRIWTWFSACAFLEPFPWFNRELITQENKQTRHCTYVRPFKKEKKIATTPGRQSLKKYKPKVGATLNGTII